MTVRLPDFLIIGAFKSGTTSMINYLGQHPSIFVPWLQEPNFFGSPSFSTATDRGTEPQRGPGVYGRMRTDSLGQYSALFADATPGQIVGESSPQYLREPAACARIRELAPDVKLFAILRHPAERAFSDWSMFHRDGLETADFATAVHRPRSLTSGQHFVETGFYGRQLAPFFEAFPREQLRVHLYEDLVADPAALVRSTYDWLGVDPEFRPDTDEVRNVSGMPRNRAVAAAYRARRRLQPYLKPIVPPQLQRAVDSRLSKGLARPTMDPAVRDELVDIYADDIRLLGQLLDRDLSGWLRQSAPMPTTR